MGTPFHFELVTPERVLFSGDADAVSLRTVEGEITFLARHEDYVGVADETVVRISALGDEAVGGAERERTELRAAVHSGLVHVDREGVVILAGVAELGSEIDVDRARAALVAAEARLAEAAPAPEPGAPDGGEGPGSTARADPPGISPEDAVRREKVRLEAAGSTAQT
ncbi:MAG: F0F1 ATP synthase subunit epsilon [Acidimicrobiales bacterium]|jgi:F-type H+-transporting ATPase subunit epsilon